MKILALRLVTGFMLLTTWILVDEIHAQPTDSLQEARVAFAEGRYAGVIERLKHHPGIDSSAGGLYLLGQSYQALLQHEAALDALRRAHALDTSSVRTLQALGQSHAALSQFAEAESAYQKALVRIPSPSLHLRLGELYLRIQNWQEAAIHYRILLRRDSTNSLLHARLAQTLAARGRSDAALRHYRRAHRLNPRNASVALELSELFIDDRQPTAALRAIDRTLHYQDIAALWKRRGALTFALDSLVAANRAYERAIALGDSSTISFRRLGIIRVGRHRYASALHPLRIARRRDSTDARTYFYLGVAYRGVDSLHQSAAAFEKAINLVASDVLIDAYVQAAVTQDTLGNLEAALDAYKTALKIQPERSDLYFHLATLYDRYYRDKTPAARYYRLFLTRADSLPTPFRSYASRRLEALRPVLHFQQGRAH